MFFHASVVSDKNICDMSAWIHVHVLHVGFCACVSTSAGLCVQDRTSKLHVQRLRFIQANEEAEKVLLGRSGNTHSEVTSKAG